MSLLEILGYGGSGVALLMILLQVSKIEINPWSYLAQKFGRAINRDVIKIYVAKIKNGEINPKTGEAWTVEDVPKLWRAKVSAALG